MTKVIVIGSLGLLHIFLKYLTSFKKYGGGYKHNFSGRGAGELNIIHNIVAGDKGSRKKIGMFLV